MPDNGELAEKQSISMYPSDWAIVREADTGDAGTSATVRRIIREWHELTRPLARHRAHLLTDTRAYYTTDRDGYVTERDAAHETLVTHTFNGDEREVGA